MVKDLVKEVPSLLSRLTLGWVFMQSGWGKLHNLEDVTKFFMDLGIPFAQTQAPFVAGLEFVCGAFILIGLFTRWAALPVIPIMIVAIVTAKRADINELSDLLGLSEFLYIVIAAWLSVYGSELLAADSIVRRIRSGRTRAS